MQKFFITLKTIFFKNLKLNIYLKPVLGMFITGIIGMAFPEILGIGYGWLQAVIDGKFQIFNTYGTFYIIFHIFSFYKDNIYIFYSRFWSFWRCICTSLFIGGFLGVGMGIVFHDLFPSLVHTNT